MGLLEEIQQRQKKVKLGGSLLELAPTSEAEGRQAATDPLTGGLLGARADSVKMRGTPANLRAQVEAGVSAGVQEAKAAAARMTGKVSTAEAQAQEKEIERVKGMGAFEERLPALQMQYVSRQLMSQAPEAKPLVNYANIPKKTTAEGKQEENTAAKSALDMIAGGDVANGVLLLSSALGRTTKNPLTVQELSTFFLSNADSITKTASEFLPDANKVGWALTPEVAASYGFGNTGEMASYLNTSEDQLRNWTQDSLQDAIRAKQGQYTDIAQLEALMYSGDAASKAFAHQKLIEAGYVGRRQASEKYNNIVAQIEDGDTVSVAGTHMTVDEILSDKGLRSIIEQATSSPGYLAQLAADPNFKDFSDFISKNMNALEGMSGARTSAVTELGGRAAEGEAVSSRLTTEAMQKLWPGYGISNLTPPDSIKALDSLAKSNPDMLSKLLQFTSSNNLWSELATQGNDPNKMLSWMTAKQAEATATAKKKEEEDKAAEIAASMDKVARSYSLSTQELQTLGYDGKDSTNIPMIVQWASRILKKYPGIDRSAMIQKLKANEQQILTLGDTEEAINAWLFPKEVLEAAKPKASEDPQIQQLIEILKKNADTLATAFKPGSYASIMNDGLATAARTGNVAALKTFMETLFPATHQNPMAFQVASEFISNIEKTRPLSRQEQVRSALQDQFKDGKTVVEHIADYAKNFQVNRKSTAGIRNLNEMETAIKNKQWQRAIDIINTPNAFEYKVPGTMEAMQSLKRLIEDGLKFGIIREGAFKSSGGLTQDISGARFSLPGYNPQSTLSSPFEGKYGQNIM